MNGYFLITGLKLPGEGQAELGASQSDIAAVVVVPPDSLRLEPQPNIDLCDGATSDRLIRSIMRAVKACGEQDAQMGFFTDNPPA